MNKQSLQEIIIRCKKRDKTPVGCWINDYTQQNVASCEFRYSVDGKCYRPRDKRIQKIVTDKTTKYLLR